MASSYASVSLSQGTQTCVFRNLLELNEVCLSQMVGMEDNVTQPRMG